MIAFLLASCLEQVPLVDEPELTIWRFTRTLANEYYDGNDLFSDIWGVMKIETPKGAYLIAADPLWHRVLYSREGDKGNIYAFGTGTLLEPYDIAGKFPNIFITDQLKGMVAQYEMVDSADGYSFRLKRWIGGATGTEPHLNWPKGIAYSDNGTPGALSDDYIYVVDIKLGKIFKFRVSDGEFASSKIAPVSLIHPIDIAIGKEVFGNQVRNTDSLYVLDQMNFRIACLRDGDSSYFYEIKFRPITYLRSIDTDPCGRILVSTSYESIHIFEILSLSPFMVDTCVFPGPPFNKIHDVYVSGIEVIVSERWTDNTGISLYRITDECAPE
ncbi:MAG: hypothetical protein ABIM19_09185 [candidate division WOR-3 bacterium]